MAPALTFWLDRLFSGVSFPTAEARSSHRNPMKIEVEHQPDYLWRDLGFAPALRSVEHECPQMK